MQPLRIPFAVDYIDETVNAYITALNARRTGREISWAADVLDQYFQHHRHINDTSDAYTVYKTSLAECTARGNSIPFLHGPIKDPPVDIHDFTNLALTRHSIRWFQRRPVPREVIDQAIYAGIQAPTACNRQPFIFRVFDDLELVRKVLAIPYGATGYAHNVPVITAVIGQQRHFFSERDRHLIYVDASLATMGFLLALQAQGMSSCCIHWPDLASREAALSELLGLKPDERPIMLVAIGYANPDGKVAFSPKKDLDQVRRYN